MRSLPLAALLTLTTAAHAETLYAVSAGSTGATLYRVDTRVDPNLAVAVGAVDGLPFTQGNTLAITTDRRDALWLTVDEDLWRVNPATGASQQVAAGALPTDEITGLAFDPATNLLVAADIDGNVYTFDRTGASVATYVAGTTPAITELFWMPQFGVVAIDDGEDALRFNPLTGAWAYLGFSLRSSCCGAEPSERGFVWSIDDGTFYEFTVDDAILRHDADPTFTTVTETDLGLVEDGSGLSLSMDLVTVGSLDPRLVIRQAPTCVGTTQDIRLRGFVPNDQFAVLRSDAAGSTTLSAGPCAGTRVDLDRPQFVGAFSTRDGMPSYAPTTVAAGCARPVIQLLDLATCRVSNLASF